MDKQMPQHVTSLCGVPHIMSYLDDIFVISPTLDHSQKTVQNLLDALVSIGMKPNLRKTKLLYIDEEGKVDTTKSITIQNPQTHSSQSLQHNTINDKDNNNSSSSSLSSFSTSIMNEFFNNSLTNNINNNNVITNNDNDTTTICCEESLKVLGAVLTLNETIREAYFIKKATDTINIMLSSVQFRKQSFLLLARLCISNKLVHLLRTLPIRTQILRDFDEIIYTIITKVFNLPNKAMKELIFMPQQLGGLGITALSSVQLIASISLQSEMLKIPHIKHIATMYEARRIERYFSEEYKQKYQNIHNYDAIPIEITDDDEEDSISNSSQNNNKQFSIQRLLKYDMDKRKETKLFYDTHAEVTWTLHPPSLLNGTIQSLNNKRLNNLPDFPSLFFAHGIWGSTDNTAGYLPHFNVFEPVTSLHDLLERDDNIITGDPRRAEAFPQHNLWMEQMQGVYKNLLESKRKGNETQYITLLANSMDSASAAWLRAIPYNNYQRMTDDEVYRSVHYRLGSADNMFEYIKQLPESCFKNSQKFILPKEKPLQLPITQESSTSKEDYSLTTTEDTQDELYNDDDELNKISNCKKKQSNKVLACPLCGNKYTKYHCSNCQVTGPIRSARHNLVKRLLASTLTQLPSALVIVEDYAADNTEGNNHTMVPDITVTIPDITREATDLERKYLNSNSHDQGFVTFSIDLTIADIHASSSRSQHRKGQFAKAAEEEKIKHYREFNRNPNNRIKVLPFALSTVGEFAPIAKDILGFINEMATKYNMLINTETLREQIDLLLETSRAEMEKVYFEQLQRKVNATNRQRKGNNINSGGINEDIMKKIEQQKLNRIPAFWVRQLNNTTKFLNECSLNKLSSQRAEELHHKLFKWMPINEGTIQEDAKAKYIQPRMELVNPTVGLFSKLPPRNRNRKKKKRKRKINDDEDSSRGANEGSTSEESNDSFHSSDLGVLERAAYHNMIKGFREAQESFRGLLTNPKSSNQLSTADLNHSIKDDSNAQKDNNNKNKNNNNHSNNNNNHSNSNNSINNDNNNKEAEVAKQVERNINSSSSSSSDHSRTADDTDTVTELESPPMSSSSSSSSSSSFLSSSISSSSTSSLSFLSQ